MSRILILDNYDSFVYTLAGYVQQLGAEVIVVRNDAFAESEIPARLEGFDGILVSPGPGTPADAGLSIAIIKYAIATHRPLFGV